MTRTSDLYGIDLSPIFLYSAWRADLYIEANEKRVFTYYQNRGSKTTPSAKCSVLCRYLRIYYLRYQWLCPCLCQKSSQDPGRGQPPNSGGLAIPDPEVTRRWPNLHGARNMRRGGLPVPVESWEVADERFRRRVAHVYSWI